ncbi:ATP cone domain-containing protein [Sphingobacterium suaedae]|uniref:ATP cone domain-containing protein n=1 Tax=Sphingobacterium suaedae TaxID=1686402 RepID=A0ABW5KDG5_9SPHI
MVRVKKYSGELVPFNPDSLRYSLSRSGATPQQVERVYRDIQKHLYDGITTKELYEIAYNCLRNHKDSYAARYSLKKALRQLGPEGFYFERWIGKLFADDGYQTVTSQIVQGHAVTHEIDVIAAKGTDLLAIECKFRNDVDAKISVTTPMYFMSRVKDISELPFSFFGKTRTFTTGWLVTNAYLTSDSKNFGEFYNLNLLAWDYPIASSIKVRVDDNGLYPVTCLTTLNDVEKSLLLKNHCILVRDLVGMPDFLDHLQIDVEKRKKILAEARELIHSPVGAE